MIYLDAEYSCRQIVARAFYQIELRTTKKGKFEVLFLFIKSENFINSGIYSS